MADFGGARVLLTSGYAQAYARWKAAELANDKVAAFYALFETLEWAHAIDEVIARIWRPRGPVEDELWWEWRRDPALGGGAVPTRMPPVVEVVTE
jgi:hypothetical protein